MDQGSLIMIPLYCRNGTVPTIKSTIFLLIRIIDILNNIIRFCIYVYFCTVATGIVLHSTSGTSKH